MPVGVGRLRADRVPHRRDREEHHAAEPRAGRLGDRLAQRVARVLEHAGHRRDLARLGQALLDEHRQHELRGVQPGLGGQAAQRRGGAQAAGADAPVGHGSLLGAGDLCGHAPCRGPGQRVDQAGHRLLGGDAGERQAQAGGLGGGRRADADQQRARRRRAERASSSRTVLADVSSAPRMVPSTHASRTSADGGVGRDGAVGDDVVDLPAAGAQAVGERRRGEVAAGEQDARRRRRAPGTASTSARAVDSPRGTRSTSTPVSRRARAVPGPTAATRASVRCRPRSTRIGTAAALVTTSQSYQPASSASRASSSSVGSSGGTVSMSGHDDGLGARGRERDDGRAATGGGAGDQHAPARERAGAVVIGHRSPARSAAPCASSSSASATPEAAGVVLVGRPGWTEPAPQASPSRPAGRRPRRAAGCGRRQRPPRRRSVRRSRPRGAPSSARSATTARRVGRWSRARRASASGSSTSGADLDGERALTGGGRHDVRARTPR